MIDCFIFSKSIKYLLWLTMICWYHVREKLGWLPLLTTLLPRHCLMWCTAQHWQSAHRAKLSASDLVYAWCIPLTGGDCVDNLITCSRNETSFVPTAFNCLGSNSIPCCLRRGSWNSVRRGSPFQKYDKQLQPSGHSLRGKMNNPPKMYSNQKIYFNQRKVVFVENRCFFQIT